uniref:Uncharacterized protein n=1 Tax=Heterorhabditis bacteriophora TaxID=37862 RepID=A0A1I7WQD7_HETBA
MGCELSYFNMAMGELASLGFVWYHACNIWAMVLEE